jgi:hypothetical protein
MGVVMISGVLMIQGFAAHEIFAPERAIPTRKRERNIRFRLTG